MEADSQPQADDQERTELLDWSKIMELLDIDKPPHEIVADDVVGKELESVNHWHEFYYTYAKWKGFTVRKENVRRDKDRTEWQRYWVCSREGFRKEKWLHLRNRKKEAKAITRTGCKADFKVTLDRQTNMWTATSFNPDHNHELASLSEIQFLRSKQQVPLVSTNQLVPVASTNQQVPESLTQDEADGGVGIRTCSVLENIAQQSGGRERLWFQRKMQHKKFGANGRAGEVETDCEGALGYLTCLAIRDENFFCRFNVDDEDRLDTIFWSDGISRRDYAMFGDVLAFDTMYRSNVYNKPLLIMAGTNHHSKTTVFAVALLSDETKSTFTWVLEQFLVCMYNKHPQVVLINGDDAMRSAVSQVLPNSIHRLCACHLETDAGNNVPDGEFKIQLSKLVYNYHSEPEFEEMWRKLIQDFNLEDNDWARTLYAKKRSWAETFLRGHFFGGMRTSQLCGSMSSYMRPFIESKHLMRDFVCQIDAGIQNIRHTEMHDDFTSRHTSPQIPESDPLNPYNRQVASKLTRAIYNLVAKEICCQNAYSVTSCDSINDCKIFKLSKFGFGEVRDQVRFSAAQNHLWCTCFLFETDGIPCCHIFAVMKHLSILHIPDSLMKSRWRQDAKMVFDLNVSRSTLLLPNVNEVTTRLGALTSDYNSLSYHACKFADTFAEAQQEIRRLTEKFKALFDQRQGSNTMALLGFDEEVAARHDNVRDPAVNNKTKGKEKDDTQSKNTKDARQATGKRKRCGICNELGHNRETCKKKYNKPERERADNTQSSQSSDRMIGSQQSGSAVRLADTCTQYTTHHYNDPFSARNFHIQLLGPAKLRMYNI